MKKTNNLILITASMIVTACVLLLINYVAVAYFVGRLQLFTVLVLVVPIICVAICSFIIGYQIKWNWKYGICIALILTLISWGTSQIIVLIEGNSLDIIGESELEDNSQNQNAPNDELMDELYDELDKKAYEYMLEQGLISEGEEIYGGDKSIEGKESNDEKNGNTDNEIASSEMYIGIQKSDPVTEVIGNIITFLIAYGLSFAGYKINKKRDVQEKIS